MELTPAIFFAGFMAAIAVVQDVVQKGFQDTLILPCRCNNSQSCYSQINNNLTDTGSYITPDGNLFVPAGTWDVQGKVCCGPDSNQSQCWTVCSYNERCETCSLGLFTNASSVNSTIRVIKGEKITFTTIFTNQGHNAITLTVNRSVQNPNFSCTGVTDPNIKLVYALKVPFNCVAIEPGIYIIYAEVTFCNHLYHPEKNFTVIVENATSPASESTSSPASESASSTSEITSSTSESILSTSESTSSMSESTSSPSESIILTSSMFESRSSQYMSMSHSVSPSTSTSQPVSLPTSTPISSVTDQNDDQNTDINDVVTILIAIVCSLIFIAVVIIIGIMCYKRCKIKQPHEEGDNDIEDLPMDQTQNEVMNRPISVTSDDSVDIDTIDLPTPARSSPTMSAGIHERTVLSEPSTQVPNDASTPHQTWV